MHDPEQEARMCGLMRRLMEENAALAEQYVRKGL